MLFISRIQALPFPFTTLHQLPPNHLDFLPRTNSFLPQPKPAIKVNNRILKPRATSNPLPLCHPKISFSIKTCTNTNPPSSTSILTRHCTHCSDNADTLFD